MKKSKTAQWVRSVLRSNGVIDVLAAFTLFFPLLDLPLPGFSSYTIQFAFASGGWGIAALTLGIGRIWASSQPKFYWMLLVLGLVEGVVLSIYCLVSVFLLDMSLLQIFLPLSVGSVFGVLYFISLLVYMRSRRQG